MIGAPGIPRPSRWSRALLASCIAGCASSAAFAYAGGYDVALRTAGIVAVDMATPPLPAEPPIPGAEWTDAARLAAYLRLHHTSDHRVVVLYPLAAYAAATRRVDAAPLMVYRFPRSASARRTAALAPG